MNAKHFSFAKFKVSRIKFSIVLGLALIGLFCAGTGIASASDYYVSTSGSNSHSGTSVSNAWATPSYAAQQAIAGDTIYLMDGTWYNEHIEFSNSGTAGNPITMKAYNRRQAILDGQDCSDSGGMGIWIGRMFNGRSYIDIEGIVVKKYQYGVYVREGSHINITDCDVSFTRGQGVQFIDATYSVLENSDIHDIGFNSVMIESSTRAEGSHYVTIRNNRIYDNPGASGYGGHNAIDFSQDADSQSVALSDIEISGNIINDINDNGIFTHSKLSEGGMYNITIKNNIFNNCIWGVQASHFDINSEVSNNVIYGSRNIGLYATTGGNATIKNNIIINNERGISGCKIGELLYNNIWNNDLNYGGGASASPTDISVNPLFVSPSSQNFHLQAGSPCIDKGDPSSQYSNEPSPNGGRINMGAYGNTAEAATSDGSVPPDTTPPIRSNGAPSGTLSAGTTATTLSLTTNENADCKYSTSAGVSYSSMSNTFPTTGTTSHSTTITGLTDGNNYTYYIRCRDKSDNANANTNDYLISFSVDEAGTPPPPDQLIAHYKFDETSGNTATDSSDNNNTGTLTNMNTSTAWVNGKINGGLEFDGVDDYVRVSDSTSLDNITQGITLMAWVKIPVGDRQSVFARWLYGTDIYERSFEFDISSNGTMNFGLSSDGTNSNANWLVSNGTITSNEWTHIAVSSDGTTMKMYINGQPDPNTAISPANGIHQGKDLHIGAWEYNQGARGSNFQGAIDEARVYNYALTASQIQQHYEDGNVQAPPTNMSINLDLQGKPITGNRELLFSVYNTGQSTPIYEKTIYTDNNDDINIDLSDFPENRYSNYDIKIKMSHYLSKKILNHNLVDDITTSVSLKLGDINDDNVINQFDYATMGYVWFTSNANSDLNEDGIVNSLDLSWLNRNWLESGD